MIKNNYLKTVFLWLVFAHAALQSFGAPLPEFVKSYQSAESFLKQEEFLRFISPIVIAQQKHLRSSIQENGVSSDPEEVVRRIHESYLAGLEELELKEHSEIIENFIALVFSESGVDEMQIACIHYFASMAVLKPETFDIINEYVARQSVSDEVLMMLYDKFILFSIGGGKLAFPLKLKERLLAAYTTRFYAATDEKMITEFMFDSAIVAADLIKNEYTSEASQVETAATILKIVGKLRVEGELEHATNLLVFFGPRLRAVKTKLPLGINEIYVEEALNVLKSNIEAKTDFSRLNAVSWTLTRLAISPLEQKDRSSPVFDLLYDVMMSEESGPLLKSLIAVNFVLLDNAPLEVDEEVVRLWKSEGLDRSIRYEMLHNLIDGHHPEFDRLLLEEVRFFEESIELNPDGLSKDELKRLGALTGQLSRKLKMQEVDIGYLNSDAYERLKILRSSGRLERLE